MNPSSFYAVVAFSRSSLVHIYGETPLKDVERRLKRADPALLSAIQRCL